MGQPRSVKKQVREAEKLQEALNTDPTKVAPIDKPAEELEQPAAVAAVEKPNLDQPVIPAIGEEPKVDETDWEKRYKGLQTRYNREVPELRGQLKTALTEIDGFKTELETVREEIQKVEIRPAPQDIELTDELREQYGEGMIGVMTEIAKQSNTDMAKQIVDLQQQLANVKQGVTHDREVVVVNNERSFFVALDKSVKEATGKSWKDINDDDNFHNFLAEKVPYTDHEKQDFLAKARENLNVEAAAKFFIDYAGPSSEKEPSPYIVPEVPEELITPEVAGGNIPPIEEAKVYTTAEVDQFYSDKRKGKYKDKNEARKIEQDILTAGREGRIVTRRAPAYA